MLAELKADHVKRNTVSRQKVGSTNVEPHQHVHRLDACHWTTDLVKSISSIGGDEGAAVPAIQDVVPPQPSPHSLSLRDVVDVSDDVFALDVQSSRSRHHAPTVEECMQRLTDGVQDDQEPETQQKRKSVNGWTLHLSSMWSSVSRRAGENPKEWRLRVLRQARETWDVPGLFCFSTCSFAKVVVPQCCYQAACTLP